MVKYGSGSPEQPNAFFVTNNKAIIYVKMDLQKDYQFIQVPMNLFYLMDANCSKVFTTLIQMDSFYPKEEGYFECAYKTLELACGMSRPVIKASLAGLYLEGIVDVVSVGQGRGKHTNRYKVNVERFKDYEKINLGIAIMTEDKPIHQVKYKGERFQVPWDEKPIEKQSEKGSEKKVTTNIDNIENIDNLKNIDNIDILNTKETIDTKDYKDYIIYFVNNHKEYDYILLSCNKDRFFSKYRDSVLQLEKDIGENTGNTVSIQVVLEGIYDYVQEIGRL